ncbi:hypothetical protein PS2_023064 [Malus domestica]
MKDRPRWKYGKPFGEGTWREGNKSGNHILLRVYRSEQRLGWPAKEFARLGNQIESHAFYADPTLDLS